MRSPPKPPVDRVAGAPTPRCAAPTLAPASLLADRRRCGGPEALRVPARLNRVVPLPGLGPQPYVRA